MPSANAAAMSSIPLWYRLFFLYIEPVATAVGAYYAWFQQHEYLDLTYTSASAVSLGPSARESIVLSQLANMYAVFALNEALVLRSTTNLRVWSVFLFGLLLADFGHIYSVKDVGFDIYWKFWDWNSMYWGNLGFVYMGAATRTAFLAGVGV
ncbi:hypothetical protein D6C78_07099 [Aureobasidium pullulans]|uniref:DUF7704 domain-containing protein n=1 Tax=Aureobasidium pullulans TaxID=5580 RepID=A0A4V4LE01_AURPU|nr:hypothetical protein D6C78_07099 [Aureobasidium pullulans]